MSHLHSAGRDANLGIVFLLCFFLFGGCFVGFGVFQVVNGCNPPEN